MSTLATVREAPASTATSRCSRTGWRRRWPPTQALRRHRGRDFDCRREAAAPAPRLPLDVYGRAGERTSRCRRRCCRSSSARRRSSTTTCSTEPMCAAGGRPCGPSTARAPPRRPATISSPARSGAARGDEGFGEALAVLAEAALALARGEAMQRRQAFCPDTSVEEYLARCSLKTGKLFEAACLLGGNGRALGPFGLALGIAFQITDDILDCTGDHRSTGKVGGVDLRDGTPTLPLLIAAQRDSGGARALSGERSRTRSGAWRRPVRSTRPGSSLPTSRPRHGPPRRRAGSRVPRGSDPRRRGRER